MQVQAPFGSKLENPLPSDWVPPLIGDRIGKEEKLNYERLRSNWKVQYVPRPFGKYGIKVADKGWERFDEAKKNRLKKTMEEGNQIKSTFIRKFPLRYADGSGPGSEFQACMFQKAQLWRPGE